MDPELIEAHRLHDAAPALQDGESAYTCSPIDMVNFKGRNTLCCGGRLFMGPDLKYLVAVILLATVPCVSFAINSYEIFQEQMPGGAVWSFVPLALYAVLMYNLGWAAVLDPGVIPRDLSAEAQKKGKRDFIKEQDSVQYKWCRTCHIYRPPRSKHCPVCDNCVDKFDHHCPWVGNCIARRNYVYFQCFIHVSFILVLFGFVLSYIHLTLYAHKYGVNLINAMGYNPGTLITLCVAFLGLLPVGGLSVYHGYLASVNRTTNEDVNDVFKRVENPYSQGCSKNCFEVLCPRPRVSKLLPTTQRGKETPQKKKETTKLPTRMVGSDARSRGMSDVDLQVNPMAGELGSPETPQSTRQSGGHV